MRRTMAMTRKELQMYFYSPIAYAAFAFFFVIAGYFFSANFLYPPYVVDVRPVFGNVTFVFLFIIPLLTMRLVSDELRQGTDELLLTSPVSITEIVVGKYASALTVLLMLVAGSLLYPLILSAYGPLDQPVLWLSYLAMFLVGAAMMAVGLFASSLSAHQMVSGIAAFASCSCSGRSSGSGIRRRESQRFSRHVLHRQPGRRPAEGCARFRRRAVLRDVHSGVSGA